MKNKQEKLIYDLRNKNDELNNILQVALNKDIIDFNEYIELTMIFEKVNKEINKYEVKIK